MKRPVLHWLAILHRVLALLVVGFVVEVEIHRYQWNYVDHLDLTSTIPGAHENAATEMVLIALVGVYAVLFLLTKAEEIMVGIDHEYNSRITATFLRNILLKRDARADAKDNQEVWSPPDRQAVERAINSLDPLKPPRQLTREERERKAVDEIGKYKPK